MNFLSILSAGCVNTTSSTTTDTTTPCAVVLVPVFDPPTGSHVLFPCYVAILNPNVGGTIYYTTDGTGPTFESPVYSGPILMESSDDMVRAFVMAPGCVCESAVVNCVLVADSQMAALTQECELLNDSVGTFDEWAANGVVDNELHLTLDFSSPTVVERIEVCAYDQYGVWTGAVWATDAPVAPEQSEAPVFPLPLRVEEAAVPLNAAYGAPIATLDGSHDLVLLGDSLGTLLLQGLYIKVTVFLEVGEPLVRLFASSCTTTSTTTCTDNVLGTVTPNVNTGALVSFGTFPAGDYRVEYLNGALRYGTNVYYVNAGVSFGFRIVHNGGGAMIEGPGNGYTGYPSQALCESGNALAATGFIHTGGTIGMMLQDSPYEDNLAGNPSPTFQLRLACSDPLTTTTTSTTTSPGCCNVYPEILYASFTTGIGNGTVELGLVQDGNGVCHFAGTVTLTDDGNPPRDFAISIFVGVGPRWFLSATAVVPTGGCNSHGFPGEYLSGCSTPLLFSAESAGACGDWTITISEYPFTDSCCEFYPNTLAAEMNTDLGNGSTTLNKIVIDGNCAFRGTVTLVDGEVEIVATLTIYKGITNWQYELAPVDGVPCTGFTGESGGGLGPYPIIGCAMPGEVLISGGDCGAAHIVLT